ncbi:LIC_10730 family protein [Leptospira sarikeiensis]|uniref:Lipoprotein n=1 Tax=Leptospira sarikeiensis TaxID=2484943 RepID=A0A4V3JS80_9LEPT|nr:hypothetical protein [Leptospira sarikeiensis]TGL63620.1 hypothetical protein EHQ64_06620 [Leptospira sarikeiensis]
MKTKSGLFLLFFLFNCYFAVDWSSGAPEKTKGKPSPEEIAEPEQSNLSRKELIQKGKKSDFKSKEEQQLFEMMSSGGSDSNYTRNCMAKYGNCKDSCWTNFPSPKVETVFTAITVDRKREDCIARCRNICDNFDPASSSGTMPNSGKGNYSDPNAPRY